MSWAQVHWCHEITSVMSGCQEQVEVAVTVPPLHRALVQIVSTWFGRRKALSQHCACASAASMVLLQ
jgi:hypothetical protein